MNKIDNYPYLPELKIVYRKGYVDIGIVTEKSQSAKSAAFEIDGRKIQTYQRNKR